MVRDMIAANGKDGGRAPILVITSQVVRGGIGGRGAVFALERLGHPVWFVPTILLPWHPGQGKGHRLVASEADFKALLDDLIGSDKLGEIGGILTGYLGAAYQAGPIARLIETVRKQNPAVRYLCDPIIGDGDQLYVPEATAAAVRYQLLPLADIATPNAFELSWLTGKTVDSELQALSAARHLGPERVLVTSSPAMRRNSVANLLVSPSGAMAAEHAAVAGSPHGTGDLVSSLLLARLLDGMSDEEAVTRAAASTFEIVARSVKKGSSELLFAEEQMALDRPMSLVSTRRVMEMAVRA